MSIIAVAVLWCGQSVGAPCERLEKFAPGGDAAERGVGGGNVQIGAYYLQGYAQTSNHVHDVRACGLDFIAQVWMKGSHRVFDDFSREGLWAIGIGDMPPRPKNGQASVAHRLEVVDGRLAAMKEHPAIHLFDLIEVMLRRGDARRFISRLEPWRSYLKAGLCTPCEEPTLESRSDCHAWGSHPLYHLQRGVAGVRSAGPGFRRVSVMPCPGTMKWIRSRTPHPQGEIAVDLSFGPEGSVSGRIELPANVAGDFFWQKSRRPLKPGMNVIKRMNEANEAKPTN